VERPDGAVPERELVERLTQAFEASDVDGIVALLAEDVRLAMPPVEYQGREAASGFLALTAVTYWQGTGSRLVATRANGQSAFGLYVRDPHTRVFHALGLMVISRAGSRVAAITRFDTSVLPRFVLPRALPD
jgi:RNA polymerase sigma-70 factor (ECF subfamily)